MTALKGLQEPESVSRLPEEPPPSGHALLPYFQFEPGFVNLNVGSEGAVPRPVEDACNVLSRQSEVSPDKWKKIIRRGLIKDTRARIAPMVGADPEELVFITSSSHSIDTVLQNFEWTSDDVILHMSTTWKGATGDVKYIRDTNSAHPKVSTYEVNFPTTTQFIIEEFRARLRAICTSQFRGEFNGAPAPKAVAIIDAICSKPGIRFPWPEMVRICREEGAYSLIDAAHCIGQELDINLSVSQPDFWITSCHKWLYAKRGCSLLYVPRRNHHLMKSGFPHNFYPHSPTSTLQERLEDSMTRDYTSFLSVNAALDFRQWLGGEYKINAYCHNLALAGGRRMASIFNTNLMDETGEFTLNMVNVRLPLSAEVGESHDLVSFVDRKLLVEYNVYGLVFKHNGVWWVRCCAQVWNEIGDFEFFARVLMQLCREIEDSFGTP